MDDETTRREALSNARAAMLGLRPAGRYSETVPDGTGPNNSSLVAFHDPSQRDPYEILALATLLDHGVRNAIIAATARDRASAQWLADVVDNLPGDRRQKMFIDVVEQYRLVDAVPSLVADLKSVSTVRNDLAHGVMIQLADGEQLQFRLRGQKTASTPWDPSRVEEAFEAADRLLAAWPDLLAALPPLRDVYPDSTWAV